ncbi:MAG: RNA polymerase sigma factor [Acidimicrobiales bacterium]
MSVSVHIEGAAMQDERRERFDTLYRLASAKILAYALRRAPSAEDAADVAAETFTIAWRRLDQVPVGEEAILWLYVVARNVLHNEHRRRHRRTELIERVALHVPESAWRSLPRDEEGLVALLCLRALSEEEREVLMLTAWEGLRPAEIARVLGCSPSAARVRLHRARRRLRQAIAGTTRDEGDLKQEGRYGHGLDGPRIATSDPQGGLTP